MLQNARSLTHSLTHSVGQNLMRMVAVNVIFFRGMVTEVCKDVRVEPELQPVTHEVLNGATANSKDGARLDIAANGV